MSATLWSTVGVMLLSGQAAPPAVAGPADVEQAIRRSVAYLEKEGLAWKEVKKCASCHNAPFMLLAFNEAKSRGYAVNDKALAEVTGWVLAKDDPAKIMPGHAGPQAPLFTALGIEAAGALDAPTQEGLRKLLATLPLQQAAAGWWGLPPGGRPPIADTHEVHTGWALLALTSPRVDKQSADASKANREKALKWLASTPPGDGHQAAVVRLLLAQRLGKSKEALQPLVKDLVKRQNADGGWNQAKGMASDALATGQTLYALSVAGVTAADPAVQKGQAFLVKTQQADGSWVMTSRPSKPGDKGSKNLDPITYVGASWGTVGLAATAPKKLATAAR